jgi:signal transduction histidine kinase
MDYLDKFISQVRLRLVFLLAFNSIIVLADFWIVDQVLELNSTALVVSLIIVSALALTFLPWISANLITQPTKLIWQGILHIAPDAANMPAPNLKKPGLGHELVVYLVSHIYQLASVVDSVEKTAEHAGTDLKTDFVANSLPLPMMVLDKDQKVIFANRAMTDYIQRTPADTIGQNFYSVLDMSFGSTQTFDAWLKIVRQKEAVATQTWERVRIDVGEYRVRRQFDLAAYYNRTNPEGFETMLVLFDHSKRYEQDDQALNFVALAVHELRTPVTLLRGYIEAIEEELDGRLSPEAANFMTKLKAAAASQAAFINNMLNVARVESNQLTLKLHEEKWPEIVKTATEDISLRARLQKIQIDVDIAPNLPTVGVDRVGIYEVLINLIDNAIKYSGPGKKIVVKSYLTKDGLVETSVQDTGLGIATNLMPNLFEKFYRSHHSKGQVGGTGLGLYLSKSIVDAHGGHIWVRSKEGQGSTFGFSVQPFAALSEEQKAGESHDITRSAHGWIKNHSLYGG